MHRLVSAVALTTLGGSLLAQNEVKVVRPQPQGAGADIKTEAGVPPLKVPDIVQPQSDTGGSDAAVRPVVKQAGSHAPSSLALDPARIWFDRPGDGSLWALGAAYKASFAADAVTYIPYLGASAPKNYPVRFTLIGAKVGHLGLDVDVKADVAHHDRRVTIDRGAFTEVYELSPAGMEQMFVFSSLPTTGDLEVSVGVKTELAWSRAGDGYRFGNDLGYVTYDETVAVDADGKRLPLTCVLEDGVMTMRVPESFVTTARYPITVDPRVVTFTAHADQDADLSPDIAFDRSENRYLIVWQKAFSATDGDVLCQLQETDGRLVDNSISTIDVSGENWTRPRVANHAISRRFLVVATTGAAPSRVIKGRTRDAAFPVQMSNQFQISGGEGGDKHHADVGGDPSSAAPTFFLVVWQRDLNAGDTDIHARLVTGDAQLPSGLILVDNTLGTLDGNPAVSKSDGNSPSPSQAWGVTWQRRLSSADEDIRAALVSWDGTITMASTSINASARKDLNAAVSSITDDINGNRFWLIVWEGEISTFDNDIFGQLMNGTSMVGTTVNLSAMVGGRTQHQTLPHVDCDGVRFAVVWQELFSSSFTDFDALVSTFHVSFGTTLGVSEARATLLGSSVPETDVRIVANRSGGGFTVRYATVCRTTDNNGDIVGATYDGMSPNGGATIVTTGCGGLGIGTTNVPALGRSVRIDLSPAGVLLLGLPAGALPICDTCRLGVNPIFDALPSPLTIDVPPEGSLVGGTLALQGIDIGGTCLGPIRLSDTLKLTIR